MPSCKQFRLPRARMTAETVPRHGMRPGRKTTTLLKDDQQACLTCLAAMPHVLQVHRDEDTAHAVLCNSVDCMRGLPAKDAHDGTCLSCNAPVNDWLDLSDEHDRAPAGKACARSCCTEAADTVLLPCAHREYCGACISRKKNCPVQGCGVEIERRVRLLTAEPAPQL